MTAARTVSLDQIVTPTGHQNVTVSIVIPTLNERGYLTDCLATLDAQDDPRVVEILVVDGGSTDGTRELVQRWGGRVRLVDNPAVTAASAMNVGLEAAAGVVICRADAHAVFATDFVRRNVDLLLESGATNVGGPMRAVGKNAFGRAVAAVTSSPLGVGPGRFHYATERAEVETVYLGCWWTETVRDAGGWDGENLQWAAEDQELNFRLRQAGGVILLDPGIRSWYFPRDTAKSLWRQYENYGVAKASTLAKHRTLPYWRPLVPAAMVGAAAALALVGRRPVVRVAVPAVHVVATGVAAFRFGREPGVAPHRAWLALLICHWSYGIGFWRGLGRIVSGRGFDTRPSNHR